MEHPILIAALVIAAIAATVAAWQWRHAQRANVDRASLQNQLNALQQVAEQRLAEAARLPDLQSRLAAAEADAQQLHQELVASAAKAAAAEAAKGLADAAARQIDGERQALLTRLDAITAEQQAQANRLAAATAERQAAIEAREQAKAFLDDAQAKLRTAFVEAASKVFDDKAATLDRKISETALTSKTGLEATLKPFQDKLGEFQLELRKLGGDHAAGLNTLVGSITQLQTLNQTMASSADNLSRALKGNAKARGDWGEMILETVLKASGLEDGHNFLKQESGRDDDSGRLLRPDVIVCLPDGRQVVVDAKVNLVAWAEANNAESPEVYQEALVRHTAALRQHVRDLADKNYPKALGANALDLTVMFVPIEGALAAALSVNPALQDEAFEKKVVFASPNTLMAMLRVVERLWTRDKLQKQVGIIGDEAGKLLDSLSQFIEEFDQIETRLDASQRAFKAARNRLADSPQSVVSRARRLVEAGAKGKKALHEELQPVASAATSFLPLPDRSQDNAT